MATDKSLSSKNFCDLNQVGNIQKCTLEQVSNSHSYAAELIGQVTSLKGSGNSATIVREAIQSACGEEQKPAQDFMSPKDGGLWLEKHGYTREYSKKIKDCVPGDVVIFEPVREHKDGHIQMLVNGGVWISDFVQNNAYPWADGKETDQYVVYSREIQ